MHMFRVDPVLPVGAMKTYQILAPLSTHWRDATCEEIDCPAMQRGWKTIIDESDKDGQRRAHYIRRISGRQFTEERGPDGLVTFTFTAGQKCFRQHRTRIERPEHFLVRPGDWRGNPTGQYFRHTEPEHWVEDFGEHQQNLADRMEKG